MKQALFVIGFASMIPLSSYGESHQRSPSVEQQKSHQFSPVSGSTAASDQVLVSDSVNIVFADQFPEVIAVDVVLVKNNNWQLNVTLSSSYDTPQRYADAWRVIDEQGNELGIRILGHDHASEQPFTRSKRIQLPESTNTVFVEGRDQVNGWSGQRFEVKLPSRGDN